MCILFIVLECRCYCNSLHHVSCCALCYAVCMLVFPVLDVWGSVRVWPAFQRQLNARHPQFDPAFVGLGCTQVVENATNRNVDPTFLFDFIYNIGLALFSHNAQRNRQTAVGIGRLCSSAGGLKKFSSGYIYNFCCSTKQ